MSYWQDRCPECGHARGFHGEGGCTAAPSFLQRLFGRSVSDTRCGCRTGQGAIPVGKG